MIKNEHFQRNETSASEADPNFSPTIRGINQSQPIAFEGTSISCPKTFCIKDESRDPSQFILCICNRLVSFYLVIILYCPLVVMSLVFLKLKWRERRKCTKNKSSQVSIRIPSLLFHARKLFREIDFVDIKKKNEATDIKCNAGRKNNVDIVPIVLVCACVIFFSLHLLLNASHSP